MEIIVATLRGQQQHTQTNMSELFVVSQVKSYACFGISARILASLAGAFRNVPSFFEFETRLNKENNPRSSGDDSSLYRRVRLRIPTLHSQ
ncbi:hypothetical protein AVEN_260592-1 [Araneus ventricosus]|uniref:Uncharacterized protein n=1 Tax=Araneus ventricosus TaxID=182803 RepID=A0A4Y2WLH4_ARAVE|nr:hypothetical protein AVEN_260592-1 [Araneus ventricosus]